MHVGGYYFQAWKDANEGMRICALLFTHGEPSGQSILFQQHCVDFIFGRFPVLRAVSFMCAVVAVLLVIINVIKYGIYSRVPHKTG